MAKKRMRRYVGDVSRLEIDEGLYTFCQVTEDNSVCFFDVFTKDPDYDINLLEGADVIFRLRVHNDAFRQDYWQFVKKIPLFEQAKGRAAHFRTEVETERYIKQRWHCPDEYITREQAIEQGLLSSGAHMGNHIYDLLRAHYYKTDCIWHKGLYP